MDRQPGSGHPVLCLVNLGKAMDQQTVRLAHRLAAAIDAPLGIRAVSGRGTVEPKESPALVVTTAGQGILGGLFAPERSPSLSRRLGVPLVLLPPQSQLPAELLASGELVCGVDASGGARSAALVASALAQRLDLPLSLVHSQAPIPAVAMAPAGAVAPLPLEELRQESRDAGWKLLEELEAETPESARLRLRSGLAASSLNDYALRQGASMIVIGAPDRGPLASLVLHSTAWELFRVSQVPVMYVPEDYASDW